MGRSLSWSTTCDAALLSVLSMFFDVSMLRSHIVDMAAAEANDLSQRGGREREQLAVAQVLFRLFAVSLQCILTIVCYSYHRLLLFILEFPWCLSLFCHSCRCAGSSGPCPSLAGRGGAKVGMRRICFFCRMFAFTIVTTNIAVGLPGHRPCATCCRCCAAVCLYSSLILIDY